MAHQINATNETYAIAMTMAPIESSLYIRMALHHSGKGAASRSPFYTIIDFQAITACYCWHPELTTVSTLLAALSEQLYVAPVESV